MSIRLTPATSPRPASPPRRRLALGGLMAAGLALSGLPALAASSPEGRVVTADELGASLTHVDLESGEVETHLIDITPHNVQVSASGRYLMAVGEAADDGHAHGQDKGHGQAPGQLMLFPVDEPGGEPLANIEVGRHPAHVVSDRDDRFAFVTNAGDASVSVVDLEAREVVASVPTGDYPHGLRLSPDGHELYVANVEDDSVSVIDTGAHEELARLPVGDAPVQVGFTPDGDRAFVSLRDENRVAVIDTATRQVVERIEVGRLPIQVHATADGLYLLVANEGTQEEPDNRVSVIDLNRLAVVATHEVGAGAHGVAVDDTGRFAFVTGRFDDSLSVIDLEAGRVIDRHAIGRGPNGVTWITND